MERPGARRLGLAAVLALGGVVSWWLLARDGVEAEHSPIPGEGGERVIVEVFNGAGIDGLARATTARLRRHGIDVVYFGTASVDTLGRTRILVRRGDRDAGVRVREVLRSGTVRIEEDSSRLVDVSVFLGRDAATLDRYP